MDTKNTAPAATETATAALDGTHPDTSIRPGTGGPTGAVWDALQANPGASVAVIAEAAKTAEHTTRRTLIAWEGSGYARRSAGGHAGGKRTPDAWYPVTTASAGPSAEDTNDTEGSVDDQDAAAAPAEADAPNSAGDLDTAGEAVTSPEEIASEAGRALDGDAVSDACAALTVLQTATREALEALNAGQGAAALTAGEEIYRSSGKIRRLVSTAVHGRPRCASGRVKARPGELQAKVAAHLDAFPGKDFTPHEIAKVVGHSAGAITNALDRLAELGKAISTCERPRRFTTADATDASTGTERR